MYPVYIEASAFLDYCRIVTFNFPRVREKVLNYKHVLSDLWKHVNKRFLYLLNVLTGQTLSMFMVIGRKGTF